MLLDEVSLLAASFSMPRLRITAEAAELAVMERTMSDASDHAKHEARHRA